MFKVDGYKPEFDIGFANLIFVDILIDNMAHSRNIDTLILDNLSYFFEKIKNRIFINIKSVKVFYILLFHIENFRNFDIAPKFITSFKFPLRKHNPVDCAYRSSRNTTELDIEFLKSHYSSCLISAFCAAAFENESPLHDYLSRITDKNFAFFPIAV